MNAEHTLAKHVLETAIAEFNGVKSLGDRAMAQLDASGMFWTPEPESNSIAVIVKHMAGNMISRWTDFLTSDGEKTDRNRDEEFVDDIADTDTLKALWEKGWAVVFEALNGLQPEDLLRTVTIRGKAHTVLQAIDRQISHYSYHAGQIVYAAKANKSAEWQTLSIPKGGSDKFNEKMKVR
ncbi:hypothetical protein SD71_00040 [Cohnella kolymensis]|uniref:DUF1572 domain-containing protein n=1 Tax=Cohnella kolymensis TaxID=1590652 RepID=A0ABR5A888_9BACL|nr:DUF1572 family protein [Cohnella kolymensis]KIL37175.1 hypothetical protein SD71_00040 [Cohnella kolymensis]